MEAVASTPIGTSIWYVIPHTQNCSMKRALPSLFHHLTVVPLPFHGLEMKVASFSAKHTIHRHTGV